MYALCSPDKFVCIPVCHKNYARYICNISNVTNLYTSCYNNSRWCCPPLTTIFATKSWMTYADVEVVISITRGPVLTGVWVAGVRGSCRKSECLTCVVMIF